MVLVLEDQITLSTRFGSSQIQLMLGDITHLPPEEKVDIICTSAFPGDYTLVFGTLIHALNRNLGINISKLARDKELDLTRIFSCWMSKPLPSDAPYRRLVCFEVLKYQTLAEQISMLFRATMPIFNGNENTMITPPLATGCQGASVEEMVGVMTNTACHWIKAGLPLKCLKLVLYAEDLDKARAHMHNKSIKLFRDLKKKWSAKESKLAITKPFDVTICYHKDDKKRVVDICETIKKENKSVTIHQDAFVMNEETSWQAEVFDTMANSIRIVVALTPSFVADKWCVEQFSLAMCCNRFKGVEMVTPFYLETVKSFPSYMNLMQYHDCRTNDKSTGEEKLLMACKDLVQAVITYKTITKSKKKTTKEMETKKPVPLYDVFISYCHRTSDIANIAVDVLSKKYPDIKVFFDRSELKTGNLWQQALYEAVDKTRCMVAMLSDEYIKSTVCQEEYNISLARLIAKDDFLLVPVCVPELSTFPKSYAETKPVSISTRDDVEQLIEKIMPSVMKLKDLKWRKERETSLIDEILLHQRYLKFSKEYQFDWDKKEIMKKNVGDKEGEDFSNLEARIAFSYTSDGVKFAAVLTEMLQQAGPMITCNLLSLNQVEARREIDNADMVVIFVSNEFLKSQHNVEELHVALCRQRLIKDRTVIYLVETSPVNEGFYYPSILPFRVGLYDHMWASFSKAFDFVVKRFNVRTQGMQGTYMCSPSEFVALQMMTKDILGLLAQRGRGSEIKTNLDNVIRIDKENHGVEEKKVSPKKVAVSVESYIPPKVHRNEDETDSESEPEETAEESNDEETMKDAEKETDIAAPNEPSAETPNEMPKETFQTNPDKAPEVTTATEGTVNRPGVLQNTTFITSPYDIESSEKTTTSDKTDNEVKNNIDVNKGDGNKDIGAETNDGKVNMKETDNNASKSETNDEENGDASKDVGSKDAIDDKQVDNCKEISNKKHASKKKRIERSTSCIVL